MLQYNTSNYNLIISLFWLGVEYIYIHVCSTAGLNIKGGPITLDK